MPGTCPFKAFGSWLRRFAYCHSAREKFAGSLLLSTKLRGIRDYRLRRGDKPQSGGAAARHRHFARNPLGKGMGLRAVTLMVVALPRCPLSRTRIQAPKQQTTKEDYATACQMRGVAGSKLTDSTEYRNKNYFAERTSRDTVTTCSRATFRNSIYAQYANDYSRAGAARGRAGRLISG